MFMFILYLGQLFEMNLNVYCGWILSSDLKQNYALNTINMNQ